MSDKSIFYSDSNFKPLSIDFSNIDIDQNYFGYPLQIPYIHISGKNNGPKLVLIAGIHGDELNGVQIIHQIAQILQSHLLEKGQILMVPIVNVPGFNTHSRYLPDRRDLNRLFPGSAESTEGHRLADLIWKSFIEDANYGIDLHSASYSRWNYPHIRANMKNKSIKNMAQQFGADIILHSKGVKGSLRRSAQDANIPFILFEAGQTNRFENNLCDIGVMGILGVMRHLEMIKSKPQNYLWPKPTLQYYQNSHWIRANGAGLFVPNAVPGDTVSEETLLGSIFTLTGKLASKITNNKSGRIMGFNLHPQVVPGRALFHVAYKPIEI